MHKKNEFANESQIEVKNKQKTSVIICFPYKAIHKLLLYIYSPINISLMDLFLRHHIYPYSYYISASNFIHTFVKWLAGSLKMIDIYHIYQIVALKCNQAKVIWAFGIDFSTRHDRQCVPNGNLFSTQCNVWG